MRKTIKFQSNLIDKDHALVLLLSGGVDSVAVAHFLSQGSHNTKLAAFHFNHCLRPQNDLMENKVRSLCVTLNIPLHVRSAKDFPCTEEESSCRNARLLALESLKSEFLGQYQGVTAHHLDDSVESYLMRSFRGTADGYVIPPVTKFNWGKIIHPFLLTPKKVFRDYVTRNSLLEYVEEDCSNTDLSVTRNWVRHKIRPDIEEKYPGLEKVVMKKVRRDYVDFGS